MFYLKQHVCVIHFCHVFRISVTYKIGPNDFDVIFLRKNWKSYYVLDANYCVTGIFQIVCFNYEIHIIFVYWSIFFFKNFKVKQIKKKKGFTTVSFTRCFVLYYLWKSKNLAHLDEAYQRYWVSKLSQN